MKTITVERLSKRYVIGRQRSHDTLRDTLSHGVRGLWSRLRQRRALQESETEFWALRDISFEISQGDIVGIIGRNGAGKSTLLKILSRITEPTAGRIALRGRVASLLEVGTGFHGELTGRENIFLNGAILGMSRQEIRQKFEEIVSFAEIGGFIDTPVKHYSSGMYVRLAFAVAAHLEPEILIIDEVLAVGDTEFQRRCIGKMSDVARSGRTVLFVSHNLAAVRSLCSTGILLHSGRCIATGSVDSILDRYSALATPSGIDYVRREAPRDAPAILRARVLTSSGTSEHAFEKPVVLEIEVAPASRANLVIGLHIYNARQEEVIHSSSEFAGPLERATPFSRITVAIPGGILNAGSYHCTLVVAERGIALFERLDHVLRFTIIDVSLNTAGTQSHDWAGVCTPRLPRWDWAP